MANDLYSFLSPKLLILIVLSCIVATDYCFEYARADYFDQDFYVSWGDGRGKMVNNGKDLTLSLDKTSGSGIQSKNQYLYGRLDMSIKLVPGNSAGTVTTFYFSSQGSSHDEIDIEFLGNSSGDPYTLHTNVYTQGYGGREQQFHLWFDPTANYHTYTIIWNPQSIFFLVDNAPIREFKNLQSYGVPYPTSQPMTVYASLWDADDWATQGGRVKTDWTKAPFIASFTNYQADACVWNNGYSSCDSNPNNSWYLKQLNAGEQGQMRWVQNNYMIYNYCTDTKRFPQGMPLECNLNH